MLVLGPAAWLLGMLALMGKPALRGSRAVFGLGIGALLAALLIAAPATGVAATRVLTGPNDSSIFASYMTGQAVWVAAVLLGAVGYGLSRFARGLPHASLAVAGETVALACTSALLLAATYSAAWPVPLAALAAGALAATVVGRGAPAWLMAAATTAVFAVTLAAADPLALIPKLAALALGIPGATYAIGRWTDLHLAAAAPPDLLMYGSLAAGFVLVYWRPSF